jgi:ubiquinone/menaquinone biosynthesis C-methylase UbiE
MADSTGADTAITATDLSQPMIDEAQAVGASRAVEWRQADIMALPFDDDASDVVVSQFGVMFLPDKGRGFAEVRRVLRPGGTFIFSVWDRLDNNGFSSAVQAGLEGYFPDDPPSFLPNAAFGYHEGSELRADLAASTLTWR